MHGPQGPLHTCIERECLEKMGSKQVFYPAAAEQAHPGGCRCPDDGGGCDWCRVYYDGPPDWHPWPKFGRIDETMPPAVTWWRYDPRNVMSAAYWFQGEIPPRFGSQAWRRNWRVVRAGMNERHPYNL